MYGERSIDGGWRDYDRRPYRSGREDISHKKVCEDERFGQYNAKEKWQ
jgi:hypothetical protein